MTQPPPRQARGLGCLCSLWSVSPVPAGSPVDNMDTQPMYTSEPTQAKLCKAAESAILPTVDPPACLGKVLIDFAKDPPISFGPAKQLRSNFKDAVDQQVAELKQGRGRGGVSLLICCGCTV